jgi:heterodisulfide reductase subunit A-like polyferredoxin
LCTACGNCYHTCTIRKAVSAELHTASIDHVKCRLCGNCLQTCSYQAIIRSH